MTSKENGENGIIVCVISTKLNYVSMCPSISVWTEKGMEVPNETNSKVFNEAKDLNKQRSNTVARIKKDFIKIICHLYLQNNDFRWRRRLEKTACRQT